MGGQMDKKGVLERVPECEAAPRLPLRLPPSCVGIYVPGRGRGQPGRAPRGQIKPCNVHLGKPRPAQAWLLAPNPAMTGRP